MDLSIISLATLVLVTLLATVAQSAVGFGFSLTAVPFFLLLLPADMAVQLAMILSFSIALIFVYRLRVFALAELVKPLLLGSVLGIPIGLLLTAEVSGAWLKTGVALTILFALGGEYLRWQLRASVPNSVFSGILSGFMVGSFAMAGPAIALYLQATRLTKHEIRATVFTVFMASYPAAYATKVLVSGANTAALKATVLLLPVVFLGAWLGQRMSDWVSELTFRKLMRIALFLTAVYLLITVFR